ncbi:MAG: hypothetical protein OXQ90_19225 [Gammaproteobacteria bacterium]|nr:hypothetical protein [Gammaproteobacteria bacterium]
MNMKLLATLIPLLSAAVACPATGADDDEVSHPQSRPAPEPMKGSHETERHRYTAVTKDGRRVPLGESVTTYTPKRKTFNGQVEKSLRARKSLPGQDARMVVFDTYTDGRRPTVRKVDPNQRAAEIAREED